MEYFKVLIFTLNKQEYAIEIESIERIINYENITPVAESQNYVEGIVEYEDSMLTIINLVKLFNMHEDESSEIDEKIVVIANDNLKIGIKVDFVVEVANFESRMFEKIPEIAVRSLKTPIKGVIKNTKNIKILLDVNKIFALNKVKELM